MKVRIGIDVGGTFTDAVAINNDTFELIGSVKIPTTHTAEEGVAAGIIMALERLLNAYDIKPEDVTFLAHGTTQATNALLEGDVSRVGIVTIGSGIQGLKSKSDTNIGDIELADGKYLRTYGEYVNSGDKEKFVQNVKEAIFELKQRGSEAIVASEAFSVDNPENENTVLDICRKEDIPACAGNDVSKLYGLKVRTRTAVINSSILPKMMDVANMTERGIKNAKIEAPLMVMRCDGGVMTVDEVRKRPILTILSGPAAGVAGALMYEKLTDGIFFEVGGTSTDISCVKDGNVVIKYAEIGGHKTYLNSLDVRTVGIGGGSMVQVVSGKAVDTGPRSAHIANLDYEVFAKTEDIVNPVLKSISPVAGDPEYAYIECENGKEYALTLSGAANIRGLVPKESYSSGNRQAAEKAWEPLARNMGLTVQEAAESVLEFAAAKNGQVVSGFIQEYGLDIQHVTFVGGGGGAASVVPHLAKTFNATYKIAKNAEVISPIGVALAMVRDMVERSIQNPTENDLLDIRREAIRKAVESGANIETVEVKIEVDPQHQKVRAIATGSTELRTKEMKSAPKTDDELLEIVAKNLGVEKGKLQMTADNGQMVAVCCEGVRKKFFVFREKICSVRLVDREGVIRLQRRNGEVAQCKPSNWRSVVRRLLDDHTIYGDGGAEIPNIYIALGSRIIDLGGMQSHKQIYSLCETELTGVQEDEDLIIVCTKTTENER